MKVADETPPTGAQVLAVFAELTGIEFRRPSDQVIRQATIFGETYTFAEMEAVIEFMRWQIRAEKCSYNEASFGWRRLMGDHGASDEWQTFDERLGLAREAVKRKAWRPKLRFHNNERLAVAEPAPKAGGQPAKAEWNESAEARAARLKAMEEFKRTVNR